MRCFGAVALLRSIGKGEQHVAGLHWIRRPVFIVLCPNPVSLTGNSLSVFVPVGLGLWRLSQPRLAGQSLITGFSSSHTERVPEPTHQDPTPGRLQPQPRSAVVESKRYFRCLLLRRRRQHLRHPALRRGWFSSRNTMCMDVRSTSPSKGVCILFQIPRFSLNQILVSTHTLEIESEIFRLKQSF